MSVQSECIATVTKLQQLVQTNTVAIPDEKLMMFYKWIQSHCCYLEKEQQPFTVDCSKIPQELSVDNYNYLARKISPILSNHYVFNGIKYIRNGTPMSDTDATSVYCHSYLSPRNIVWVDFGFNVGDEFGGKHPAIILKNLNNDVLIVAPVSTNVNNGHVASNTVITFSETDMYNMPSIRERFTNITRITPVSVYRLDTASKVGSLKKTKYQELLQKVKNYY